MKKTLLLIIGLACLSLHAQENKTFKPHLEYKNEIRIGVENFTTSIEYERQFTDHLSLGTVIRFSNEPEYYDSQNRYESFNMTLRGRVYLKDYITHSFLYLLFNDAFKIRYFFEGNVGYSKGIETITERFIDENDNYYLQRNTYDTNNIIGSFGFGGKLLLNKKFSTEFSFGPGKTFSGNQAYHGYFRTGLGYRF